MSKIDLVRKYFELAEGFSTEAGSFAEVIHPEFEATIFPNLIAPKGQMYKGSNVENGMAAGKAILKYQKYDVSHWHETPVSVIVEVRWSGEMAIDAGRLAQGTVLVAHLCCVFDYKEGKIFRQRNYDCYEPLG